MTYEELRAKLQVYKDKEQADGAKMFMDIPDRWYDNMHWRCTNDHVSTMYLKREEKGDIACLECLEPLAMTFPEDKDGPLGQENLGR